MSCIVDIVSWFVCSMNVAYRLASLEVSSLVLSRAPLRKPQRQTPLPAGMRLAGCSALLCSALSCSIQLACANTAHHWLTPGWGKQRQQTQFLFAAAPLTAVLPTGRGEMCLFRRLYFGSTATLDSGVTKRSRTHNLCAPTEIS
jgi:hypothetical protein